MDYQSAEIGIISRRGDYMIQSRSMKSISFPEYIRAYNFQENYKRVDALKERLETTENGTRFYKGSTAQFGKNPV